MERATPVIQAQNRIDTNNVFQAYSTSGQWIESRCNGICMINKGTTVATINNTLALQPEQSISINGEQYERDMTRYQVGFSGTGVNFLVVIRKFYNQD